GKHRNHSADRGPAQDKGSNDKGDYDPIVLIIPFDMNYEPTVGIDSEQKIIEEEEIVSPSVPGRQQLYYNPPTPSKRPQSQSRFDIDDKFGKFEIKTLVEDQERFPTYGDRVTGLCTMSQIDQEKKARTASRASFTRIKNQIVIGIENVAPNLRALAKVFDDSFEELNKRDGVVQELMKMDMTITEEDMIEDQEKSDEYSLMYYEIKFKAAEILDNESYSVM
ncbi:unnamed protein product, partial [Nesidiocoris tenuis]